MFRRGFQPVLRSSPKLFVISTSMAVPEFGSAAPPMIQASRWFPIMTVSSAFVPLMIPMTFHIGAILSSIIFVSDNVVPSAGPVLYVAFRPPIHPPLLILLPEIPWPSRALRIGIASRYEIGIEGILGKLEGITRFTPGLDGSPGVVGSPGYLLI